MYIIVQEDILYKHTNKIYKLTLLRKMKYNIKSKRYKKLTIRYRCILAFAYAIAFAWPEFTYAPRSTINYLHYYIYFLFIVFNIFIIKI